MATFWVSGDRAALRFWWFWRMIFDSRLKGVSSPRTPTAENFERSGSFRHLWEHPYVPAMYMPHLFLCPLYTTFIIELDPVVALIITSTSPSVIKESQWRYLQANQLTNAKFPSPVRAEFFEPDEEASENPHISTGNLAESLNRELNLPTLWPKF